MRRLAPRIHICQGAPATRASHYRVEGVALLVPAQDCVPSVPPRDYRPCLTGERYNGKCIRECFGLGVRSLTRHIQRVSVNMQPQRLVRILHSTSARQICLKAVAGAGIRKSSRTCSDRRSPNVCFYSTFPFHRGECIAHLRVRCMFMKGHLMAARVGAACLKVVLYSFMSRRVFVA